MTKFFAIRASVQDNVKQINALLRLILDINKRATKYDYIAGSSDADILAHIHEMIEDFQNEE